MLDVRGLMYRAPSLSAETITVRANVDLEARSMAAATFFGEPRVTAAMVDPLPLRKAPSAPAFSAAAMARGRNGINFSRNG
jgi:hypothetical protein